MPAWVNVLVISGLVVGAVTGIWLKGILPLIRLANRVEQTVPLLRQLVKAFGGTPNAFAVLNEIVGQLRTDSGSSLLDIVHRLDDAAGANAHATEALRVEAAAARQNSERDRKDAQEDRLHLHDLIGALSSLASTVDSNTHGLQAIKKAADGVADDLADAHRRADEVTDGAHGEAADAASRQTPAELDRPEKGAP